MRKAEEESQDDQMMKDLTGNAKCTENFKLELDALRGAGNGSRHGSG